MELPVCVSNPGYVSIIYDKTQSLCVFMNNNKFMNNNRQLPTVLITTTGLAS